MVPSLQGILSLYRTLPADVRLKRSLQFFKRLNEWTQHHATLRIYGPFNYQSQFSSASNQAFDASLKNSDPAMGIRDIEKVHTLAQQQGFILLHDFAMPANNRLLWFKKDR